MVTTLSCSVAGVAVAALLLSACAPGGSSGGASASPSPSASQILPPGGAGSDAGDGPQTAAPLPTQEAVVGETVAFETGVSVVVSSVTAVTVEAQTPGEVSGSAVVVEVTASNESDEAQDLESAVVMLSADDGEVGVGTTAGDPEPLAGSVKPGASVTGRYVFMLGSAKDRAVTVSVNYAAGEPVAIFSGKVS
ncbi:hypothetical protein [Microbacterium sp. XT11]|uniref:hypothetical protein n=1 Tax=Microbacterium sp. XT11 TaxID=367477 RepID=UPI000742D4EF|nr:hypothetical protein [Microbacterium sp. XT11]ALX66284.1 hypothetical protein AB663_001330 [Microbacterium sp. XT11]